MFGPMYLLSLYNLWQTWCLALCICHFIIFANCDVWFYVFVVTLSSLPTVVFDPMYLSFYHLCQLWCLTLCICRFIIFANCGVWPYVSVGLKLQLQDIKLAVTTSGTVGCFFYRMPQPGSDVT